MKYDYIIGLHSLASFRGSTSSDALFHFSRYTPARALRSANDCHLPRQAGLMKLHPPPCRARFLALYGLNARGRRLRSPLCLQRHPMLRYTDSYRHAPPPTLHVHTPAASGLVARPAPRPPHLPGVFSCEFNEARHCAVHPLHQFDTFALA